MGTITSRIHSKSKNIFFHLCDVMVFHFKDLLPKKGAKILHRSLSGQLNFSRQGNRDEASLQSVSQNDVAVEFRKYFFKVSGLVATSTKMCALSCVNSLETEHFFSLKCNRMESLPQNRVEISLFIRNTKGHFILATLF
jgi:hypothetical protein